MKAMFSKLFPGVGFCLALALLVAGIRAADSDRIQNREPATVNREQPTTTVVYVDQNGHQIAPPAAQPAQQVIVCGNCGARLEVPQSVLVAMPYGGNREPLTVNREPLSGPIPGQPFYGIPASGPVYYGDACEYQQVAPPPSSCWSIADQWRAPIAQLIPRPVYRSVGYRR